MTRQGRPPGADDPHAALWRDYNEKQLGRLPRPLLLHALEETGPGRDRVALDLGCGARVEVAALAAAGWRVTGIDGSPGRSVSDRQGRKE